MLCARWDRSNRFRSGGRGEVMGYVERRQEILGSSNPISGQGLTDGNGHQRNALVKVETQAIGHVEALATRELVKELFDDAQSLARDELRLAKLELKEEAKKAARASVSTGAGGVLLHGAFL